MYGAVRDDLRARLAGLRGGRAAQARARDRRRRRARTSTSPSAARCSTSAPTTTSASPTTPRWSRPRTRRSTGGASAWRRSASSAARRTLHQELEERLSAFLGTEDTILFASCFDANGGVFEALLGEEDAVDLRRAQPRLDHRRHPALQGAAATATRTATWTSSRRGSQEAAGRALPADRDRRRLLDGRLPRQARRDLRPRRAARRARAGRRLARGRLRRPAGARHARAVRRRRAGRHPHRARSARRSAARAGGYVVRRGRRSSSCCASARGRTSSRTRRARRSPARASRALDLIERSRRPARPALRQHALVPRADDGARVRRAPRRPPDRAGDARRRRPRRRGSRQALVANGVFAVASPSRSCRTARPASARRCPRPTRMRTSTSP